MKTRRPKVKLLSKAQTEIARQAFNSAGDYHRPLNDPLITCAIVWERIIRDLSPKEWQSLSPKHRAQLNLTGQATFNKLRRSLDINSAEVVVHGQVVETLRVWPDAHCAEAYADILDWLDAQGNHPWHDPVSTDEDEAGAKWFDHSKRMQRR